MAKCVICGNEAQFKFNNPGAEVQYFCIDNLPWFVNTSYLPSHVEVLSKPKPTGGSKNESRKNSDQTDTSSSEQSAPTSGALSTGSTGGTEDSVGLPETA
jgi:hypothetical protein